MIFQIGALPRSGTAWITAVLNLCPDIMCIHEPVDLQVPVPQNAYTHSGQSGSHLILPYCAAMEADLIIFIKRDSVECYESMASVLDEVVTIGEYRKYLVEPSHEYEAFADLVIDFDELFNEQTVRYIWEAISEKEFDVDKVRPMMNMNIQRESLDYKFCENFIDQVSQFNKQEGIE